MSISQLNNKLKGAETTGENEGNRPHGKNDLGAKPTPLKYI